MYVHTLSVKICCYGTEAQLLDDTAAASKAQTQLKTAQL